jgi:hypothetical protein
VIVVGRSITLVIRRYCARDTVVGTWQQVVLLVARLLRRLLLAENMFPWLLSVEQIVCAVHSHISLADYSGYKAVLWIWMRLRIIMDPHHIVKLKVRIWIRIRINLQMTSENVWNMSLFEQFFSVLSRYLKARIRIRIRIKVKGRILIRIRIRIKVKSRIRIHIKMTSRIRIRIKAMRICNSKVMLEHTMEHTLPVCSPAYTVGTLCG